MRDSKGVPMSKPNTIGRPLCLAALLAVGFGLAWGFPVGWCLSFVQSALRADDIYEQLEVWDNGTPVIASRRVGAWQDVTYRTLEGEPITFEGDRPPTLHRTGFATVPKRKRDFQRRWGSRISPINDGNRPATYWYFLHDGKTDGSGYFVGYDSKAKQRVGTIGTDGFRPGLVPTAEHFQIHSDFFPYGGGGFLPADYYYSGGYEPRSRASFRGRGRIPGWVVHLNSAGRLIRVDLRQRKVEVLFDSPELISLAKLTRGTSHQPNDEADEREYLALRTTQEVAVLDLQGNEEARYAIPTDLREQTFALYELDEEELLTETSDFIRSDGVRKHHFRWMNHAGESLREEQVEVNGMIGRFDRRVESCIIATVIPSPIVSTLVTTLLKPAQYMGNRETNNYAEALSLSLSHTWPALLLTYLLGAAFSYATYRRQCRFGLPHTGWWTLFVFVLGLPGFMGYWLHRRWPPRLPCPTCGAHAPRDRETCFACETEFPAPLPRGTEVFA
jgi:hypothetical protein